MRVTVEPATALNVKQLLNIERECFTAEAYSEHHMFDLLTSPRVVALLAKVDSGIAGFIIGLVEGSKKDMLGHIVTVDVALKHRRKGIGSILLKEIEVIFLREGAKAIYLEVRPDNRSARQLYRRQGYMEMELLDNYYSAEVHGLRLVKQLNYESNSLS